MSIKVTSWVWQHAPAKSTQLLLLLAIADHCNDEGVCYPSVQRLAEKCRITMRRAQQLIEALRASGELGVVIGEGGAINGGKTNRYYLNRYRKDMGLEPLIGIPAASPPETDCTPLPEENCREGGEERFTTPP